MSSTVSARASSGTAIPDHLHRHRLGTEHQRHRVVADRDLRRGTDQLTAAQQTTLNAQVSAFGTFPSARLRCRRRSPLWRTRAACRVRRDRRRQDHRLGDHQLGRRGGQYSLEVENLATAATLTSQAFTSSSTAASAPAR